MPAIASLEDLESARKDLLEAKNLDDEISMGNGHETRLRAEALQRGGTDTEHVICH
jgi:hypothetical protein